MPTQPPRLLTTRRRLAAGAALALPTIVTRPARAAGNLTLMGFGGWFETRFTSTILEAFRKAHPDIGVFYYPAGNSFQSLGILRAQRLFPSTDVVLLDSVVAAQATAETLLAPISAETMPVLNDLIPTATVPGVAGRALLLDSLALCYSPTQLGEAPRSWGNLWNAAYGRRIALQTPPDAAALALTVVAGRVFGNGDLPRLLEFGIVALTQLMQRVAKWDPVPDIYTAITAGDAAIGPGWNGRAQNQIEQNRAVGTPDRFAAVIPEDGSPVRITTINLVDRAPRPEAARVLIAWLLSPEGQRLLTGSMALAPVNPHADIPAAALARAGATPEMVARRTPLDWPTIEFNRAAIGAEWRRLGLGRI